ncbi:MAG: site-specific DNA-methyltransferase [Acidobacteria bacterium]|nr:site-specific DNA-methyltransferase [Acidobacteriota bacterium]
MTPAGSKKGHPNFHYESRTVGWRPTCACYAPVYANLGYDWDTPGFTFPDGAECDRAAWLLRLLAGKCAEYLPPVPQTILDPFGGAGTTALVAIQHGRRAVSIELNAEYIELTRERLAPILAQPPLFRLTPGCSGRGLDESEAEQLDLLAAPLNLVN